MQAQSSDALVATQLLWIVDLDLSRVLAILWDHELARTRAGSGKLPHRDDLPVWSATPFDYQVTRRDQQREREDEKPVKASDPPAHRRVLHLTIPQPAS